jgi:hypothetical protein
MKAIAVVYFIATIPLRIVGWGVGAALLTLVQAYRKGAEDAEDLEYYLSKILSSLMRRLDRY